MTNPPLTYSNYSSLRSCGAKFRYSVIEKLPQPPAVALEFGSALHAGLNDALVNKNTESAVGVFEAFWDSSTPNLSFGGERHNQGELGSMGRRFVANFLKRYGSKMNLKVGEARFSADFEGTPVEGTPDALVEWEGKNVLLDFKSSAYNYLPEKSEISLQLNLYAWLLEQNGYKADSLCYVVFNKATGSIQTPLLVPYDKEKALQMIQEAVTVWKRELGHYDRNPNSCIIGKSICPYFGKCWK